MKNDIRGWGVGVGTTEEDGQFTGEEKRRNTHSLSLPLYLSIFLNVFVSLYHFAHLNCPLTAWLFLPPAPSLCAFIKYLFFYFIFVFVLISFHFILVLIFPSGNAHLVNSSKLLVCNIGCCTSPHCEQGCLFD